MLYKSIEAIFFVSEADNIQASMAPRMTKFNGIIFCEKVITIISCFIGAVHIIADPEKIDMDAKVSIGKVKGSLSSRNMKGLQLLGPQITHKLNRIE
jgi:hypothetical protein